MLLFWPVVSLLGFVVLAVLVIALGTSSTSRYEFDRNRVQGARETTAVPAGAGDVSAGTGAAPIGSGSAGRAAGEQNLGSTGPLAAQGMRSEQGGAVSVASHPAGKRLVGPGSAPAWWLVDEFGEQPGDVVAGPFPERLDADWAALSGGLSEVSRVVYGEQRADGSGLVRRQLPQERAWLSELGDQLDRLAEDWNALLTDEDALTTMVVEVAAGLVEAGLTLHDCTSGGPAGGVCLTPEAGHRGVVVSWHRHERMSLQQLRGAELDTVVQRTMNAALADLLAELGFAVEPFGETGCSLVTALEWQG
ncbi:MAG: hypothetical protein JWR62_374 [Modestobacter sp.]|nr:hypothetical protein [Modestobacter sp.]